MTEDRYIELASLAALGALDGEDRTGFESHLASCAACRRELSVHEEVAGRIPLGLGLVPVPPRVRSRLLATTAPRTTAAPAPRAGLFPGLAAAAALVLAFGLFLMRAQRDEARREAEAARQSAQSAESEVRKTREQLAALERSLAQELALRELVAQPDSRVAPLAGLKDAPQARGRVVWNPKSREAVLIAAGLPPAPEGKAYEVWVIAQAAPVPAGLFQVGPDGSAIFRLPIVDETARVKTFAVTLEPAAGATAPSGPMVLAGTVS